MGNLVSPQLADYQAAAAKYKKELLAMPIIGLEEILPYVTVRFGIRYKEVVGDIAVNAQIAPYKTTMKSAEDVNLNFRELETFFGGLVQPFDPNQAATLIIGQNAMTKGEGMKNAEIAKRVLVAIAKSITENLNAVLWSAVRDANGTTTKDLFNGWDTITTAEVTAGKIAADKGNYVKLTEEITSENAVDLLKKAYRDAHKVLRGVKTFMFVPQDVLDAYNDAYSTLHNATPYVQGFEQLYLEGSNKKCEIVALTSKADSKYIHISTKENMLIGCDQLSDTEKLEVEKHAPFTLDYVATMFFGVDFESIDARRLMVVEMVLPKE